MSAELVKELHEQRLINKAHDMMHRAFVGQLELEIFSERDESLVALQRLVAEEPVTDFSVALVENPEGTHSTPFSNPAWHYVRGLQQR